jgi:hypothetical protein
MLDGLHPAKMIRATAVYIVDVVFNIVPFMAAKDEP